MPELISVYYDDNDDDDDDDGRVWFQPPEPGSCMQANASWVSQSLDCSFPVSALILTQSNCGSPTVHRLA